MARAADRKYNVLASLFVVLIFEACLFILGCYVGYYDFGGPR